ncbi:ThiF family adenylyltransferase [Sphingomonas abietis]|uniref:ThiF family adenylyltransferase n=1 Tax=Sphingomonas abietis TaxID=3012344 RepID=A0ABY7NQ86_9SPHN|nr:ThiF family adenylyltransferase [Sphingomonas abietis]WBO22717.1 ThiF family adenylyltransferase [Sphingomonas abietis]
MDTLRITGRQHSQLMAHLHDGTGLEAVAVGLCGRGGTSDRHLFVLHHLVEIPHSLCNRQIDSITWPTRSLRNLLAQAAHDRLAVIKFHSHGGGARFFSTRDDTSDAELYAAVGLKVPGEHLSAVLLPNGEIFARRLTAGSVSGPVDRISIVGDDLAFWGGAGAEDDVRTRDFDVRHRQAFGERTTRILSSLSVAVVGVSGTGSPTVEMLARLGVGRIVLVEFDVVEDKNLNRIWGAKRIHAEEKVNKARMMKAHIESLGLGTIVEIVPNRIDDPGSVRLVSTCDAVFGCMDSVEGRDILNRIATFYSLPYIDIGVRLDADGEGGMASISAGIHYLVPGGSSLRSRGVYTDADLHAEYLYRTDPVFYEDQVRRGYIKGVNVERPAVISINTAAAAFAVNELLARLHPFRTRSNGDFAIQKILFSHGRTAPREAGEPDDLLAPLVGRGDCIPLLMSPRISEAA